MSVGVLLVTHGRMGEELIAVTRRLLGGQLPLATRAIAMPCDCDDAQALREAQRCIVELDTGDGVLVLTDLYGATPSNVCARLAQLHGHLCRVSGLNLPMLLRVQNYPGQSLGELAETAATGGRNGIIITAAAEPP
jgi:PTS system mannose-specific IIA component